MNEYLLTADRALVIRRGKFGERRGKICAAPGIETTIIDTERGKSGDPDLVRRAFDADPTIKGVCAAASETSTGVQYDREGIGRIARRRDGVLLCVDAVTAVGAFDVPRDRWGLDVPGSQEAMILPKRGSGVAAAQASFAETRRAAS